jgi:quercetin dioxygenase-like cupin family protein
MKTLAALSFLCAALIGAPAVAEDPILHSRAFTWEEIQATPTGTGGYSRPVVRQKTATLDELEMHVTALPPGKTTHPPHTHANEEIIVIHEGTVDAFQNGKTTRVGPGGILFQASNEPHNLVNVGDVTAVYHVINWASPGMKVGVAAVPAAPADAAPALPSVALPPSLDRVMHDTCRQ